MARKRKITTADLDKPFGALRLPWSVGPWTTGAGPSGHCRIYSPSETHAIARTYGNELNGIGVCELTGPKNHGDAVLISQAPAMAVVIGMLKQSLTCAHAGRPQEAEKWQQEARSLAARIWHELENGLQPPKGAKGSRSALRTDGSRIRHFSIAQPESIAI